MLQVKGLPDLAIKRIFFNPSKPYDGQRLSINVDVENKGFSYNPRGGKIYAYEIDPSTPGAKPFASLNLYSTPPNRLARYTFIWPIGNFTGVKRFWISLDPEKKLPDRDRTNNVSSASVSIGVSPYPDLAIFEGDLFVQPTSPRVGTSVTVGAKVRNIRGKTASSVVVRFYAGAVDQVNQIGEVTIPSLAGYSEQVVRINWKVPLSMGETTIYAVVDPDRKIRESFENNNESSLSVRFSLGPGAAPRNFTITKISSTELLFRWQSGPDASAVGIRGYRIYCNGGLMNPDVDASNVSVKASSFSSPYKPENVLDQNLSSYWQPKTTSNQWLEFTLPSPQPIGQVIIFFYYSYPRNPNYRKYQLQAWINNSWKTLARGKGLRIDNFVFSPIVTDRFRILFDNLQYIQAFRIREVKLRVSGLITRTSYLYKRAAPGRYNCHVRGISLPLLQTPPSNTASIELGDFSPPTPPSSLKGSYNPSRYEISLSWRAPLDSDLAGYRVYMSGIDAARWDRGAVVSSDKPNSHIYRLLDGLTSPYSSYSQLKIPDTIDITLAKTYSVKEIRVFLYSSGSYRYKIWASLDGVNYTAIVDNSSKGVKGLQIHKFSKAISLKYLRIRPIGERNSNFLCSEIEVITDDLVPFTSYRVSYRPYFFARQEGSYFWGRYWKGWQWTYSPSSKRPRRFIFNNVLLSPLDLLAITDLDSGGVLARLSGNFRLWKSGWLSARRYRVELRPAFDGSQFETSAIIEQEPITKPSYIHRNIYLNKVYRYAVSALDLSGNESPLSQTVDVRVNDLTPPRAPYGLRASTAPGKVSLFWYYQRDRDFKTFIIYRNGKKILETTNSRYTDTDVVNGTTYSYQVSAVDLNGNESAKAGPVKATPTAIDLAFAEDNLLPDLFISPKNPSVYETALLIVMVRNIGSQDAPPGVLVELYDGEPKAGGKKLGTITINKSIPAGSGRIGTLSWNLANVAPGKHKIFAVIDPKGVISETNEKNNTASIEVNIHADRYLDTQINGIDASKFPDIDIFLRVRDATGGGLFGLDERNFKISEDSTVEHPIKVTPLSNPNAGMPKADIVFIIDTSCSMNDELQTVCKVIDDIKGLLLASRIDLKTAVYGLGAKLKCASALSKVVWRGALKSAHQEDWGPGATWAALKHPWRKDAVRIVIPISDEGSFGGSPWTKEDSEALDEAIRAAKSSTPNVHYFPFWGNELSPSDKIVKEMRRMAASTNGDAFPFKNATQVVQAIVMAVTRSISDYKLSYTTHNPARDGTLRKVSVTTAFNVSKGKADGNYRAPLTTLPDLLFTGKLGANPTPLTPLRTGTLTVTVRNNGGKSAHNVEVEFFISPASKYHFTIGRIIIPKLEPASSKEVSLPWRPLPGIKKIYAVVDPKNLIKELDETNNRIEKSLNIPGNIPLDLAVTPYNIEISPFPAFKGQKVKLSARIFNFGKSEASNVQVAFFRGNPKAGGTHLGTATISKLSGQSSAIASLSYVLANWGQFELYAVVDPNDAISETFEDNNIAYRKFFIQKLSLNLSVTTDKSAYPANSDVSITVKLRNELPADWSGRGEVWIADSSGVSVAKVSDFTVTRLSPVGLKDWSFRIPLTWKVPASGAKWAFVKAEVNFTDAFRQLGISGASLDLDSLRLLKFDPQQKGGYSLIPFRFFPSKGFDSKSMARGRLLAFFSPQLPANSQQKLYLYFDRKGSSLPPLTPPKFPFTGRHLVYISEDGKIFLRERKVDGTLEKELFIVELTSRSDNTRAVAIADFNRDGAVDLLAASGYSRKFYFYPGKPNSPKRFDTAGVKIFGNLPRGTPVSMVTADLNGDGLLDVALAVSDYIYRLLGNGDGTFQIASYRDSLFRSPRAIALYDWDGDGDRDILFTTRFDTKLHLMKNDGSGNFGKSQVVQNLILPGRNAYGLAVADFNGDGEADVLVNNGGRGESYLYLSDGRGKFLPRNISSLTTNNYTAWALADWNYDGIFDIFAATYSSRKVLFFRGSGSENFDAPVQLSSARYIFLGLSVAPPSAHASFSVGTPSPLPSKNWKFKWNTGKTPAGPYRVQVRLYERDGAVAEANSPFTIVPDIKAKAQLSTDRLAYPANAPVLLLARIFNLSSNTTYATLRATIQIENSQGKQVGSISFRIRNLSAGFFRDHSENWNTGLNPPGKYTARLKVYYLGKEIASSSVTFRILSSADSGIGLLGKITVSPGVAKPGDTVTISFSVTNIGNQPFRGQELKVRIFSDSDRKEKDSYTQKVDLDLQKTANFSKKYTTSKLSKGAYTVILTTRLGSKELALDFAALELREKIVIPQLKVQILSPRDGESVQTPVVSVRGTVSDGDAKVAVNGLPAQVSGPSLKSSTFVLPRLNLSSCVAAIEATATRGKDSASHKISVQLPHRSVVLSSVSPVRKEVSSPGGLFVSSDGSLLITDSQLGKLFRLRVDSKGGIVKKTIVAENLVDPRAVIELSDGSIYIAEMSANRIVLLDRAGKKKVILTDGDGLLQPSAFALDDKGGIFIASSGNGKLFYLDKNGRVSTYADGFRQPVGLVFFSSRGTLFVLDRADGWVYSVAGRGGQPKAAVGPLPGEAGSLGRVGSWLVASDRTDSALYLVDLIDKKLKIIAGLLSGAGSIAGFPGSLRFALVSNSRGFVIGELKQLLCRSEEESLSEEEPLAERSSSELKTELTVEELSEDAGSNDKNYSKESSENFSEKVSSSEKILEGNIEGRLEAQSGCGCNGGAGISLFLLFFWLISVFSFRSVLGAQQK